MTITTFPPQVLVELAAPIDPRRIRELPAGHPGAGKPYLPIVDVIDRLNQIFGIGGWSFRVDTPPWRIDEGLPRSDDKQPGRGAVWACVGTLTVGDAHYSDMGTNAQSGPGAAAVEMAAKGAVSDAIKRCAGALGEQFGLALRDKENNSPEAVWAAWHEYVQRQQGQPAPAPESAHPAQVVGNRLPDEPAEGERYGGMDRGPAIDAAWEAMVEMAKRQRPELKQGEIAAVLGGGPNKEVLGAYYDKRPGLHPLALSQQIVGEAVTRRREATPAGW